MVMIFIVSPSGHDSMGRAPRTSRPPGRRSLAGEEHLDEFRRRGDELFTFLVDDPDGPAEVQLLEVDRGESASLHLSLHGRPGEDADRVRDFEGLFDGLDVVELAGQLDGDLTLLEGSVDFPADREIGDERDELLSLEIGHVDFPLPREMVLKVADEDHLLLEPRDHDEPAGGPGVRGHPHVRGVVQDGRVDLVRVEILEVDRRARVLCREALDEVGEGVEPHGIDGSEPEVAAHGLAKAVHLIDEHAVAMEELLTPPVVDLPLRRGSGGPLTALHELEAKLLLEVPDDLARRGLGNAAGGRTFGEALQPHHFAEDLESL